MVTTNISTGIVTGNSVTAPEPMSFTGLEGNYIQLQAVCYNYALLSAVAAPWQQQQQQRELPVRRAAICSEAVSC
jgi:hypothetical protein